MIDQIGRIRKITEAIATLEGFINENGFIFSNPNEGQSKIGNVVWDNETQRVEVQKESEE